MHGGAAAGIVPCLAEAALGVPPRRFRIRLHAPPPVQTDLSVHTEVESDGPSMTFTIAGDDGVVLSGAASADPGPDDDPVVPSSTIERLATYVTLDRGQQQRFDEFVDVETNPDFTGCFGCGHDNPDGLGLRTRPVDDGVSFIGWNPPHRWHDGEDLGMLAAVAALDCTSAFPLKQFGLTTLNEAALLGSYEAAVHRRPPASVDGGYRIVTSPRDRDGRKILADIALFDRTGEVYLSGQATWIVLAA